MALASAGYKNMYGNTVKTSEYCVSFQRYYKEDWGFMGMADYASLVPTDDYICIVRKWYKDRYGRKVANHCSEEVRVQGNKDLMNMLWWNFKNNPPSFQKVQEYFKEVESKR